MPFTGIGASSGIALGKVYIYKPFVPIIPDTELSENDIPQAKDDLKTARKKACSELSSIAKKMSEAGSPESAIFEAHLELADDEDIWDEIAEAVDDGSNPFQAVDNVFNTYIDIMASNDDELMKERAADLLDVKKRIIRNLYGLPEVNLSALQEEVIVVAHDLLPTDTATMNRDMVQGIITEVGGMTSHSAILARSYSIPAVLAVKNICEELHNNQEVIIDGIKGEVIPDPSAQDIGEYKKKRDDYIFKKSIAEQYKSKPCITKDGISIQIGANVGGTDKDSLECAKFVDLIGLFRTEFLYMQCKELPSEEQQFNEYKKLLLAYGNKPVVLRTLDIGGDKDLLCLSMPKEDNPFLGKRALRLCFDKPDLFSTQIRAALRASVYGNLWIMFPMVASMDDWYRAKQVIEDVKSDLDRDGIAYSKDIKLGIMIEIPSIAIMAEDIADEVDFASLGTNDLCQYTLAVDRGNPELTSYYQMYSPAVLRLIAHVAKAFVNANKPLCVCGEMGGDPASALVLAGVGIRKLSMSESAIANIKYTLSNKTVSDLENIAAKALSYRTASDIELFLNSKL